MRSIIVLFTLALSAPVFAQAPCDFCKAFYRGDADRSGWVDHTDPIYILNWLYQGGPQPPCLDAADANDDGFVDGSDAGFLLDYLYQGGPQPPYPTYENLDGEQLDPTLDAITPECDYQAPANTSFVMFDDVSAPQWVRQIPGHTEWDEVIDDGSALGTYAALAKHVKFRNTVNRCGTPADEGNLFDLTFSASLHQGPLLTPRILGTTRSDGTAWIRIYTEWYIQGQFNYQYDCGLGCNPSPFEGQGHWQIGQWLIMPDAYQPSATVFRMPSALDLLFGKVIATGHAQNPLWAADHYMGSLCGAQRLRKEKNQYFSNPCGMVKTPGWIFHKCEGAEEPTAAVCVSGPFLATQMCQGTSPDPDTPRYMSELTIQSIRAINGWQPEEDCTWPEGIIRWVSSESLYLCVTALPMQICIGEYQERYPSMGDPASVFPDNWRSDWE